MHTLEPLLSLRIFRPVLSVLVLAVSLFGASLLVSGCGTTPFSTSAPPATATTVSTVAALNATEPTATASVPSPLYETKVFRPVFTVELPAGWFVAERDATGAQIYLPCNTCIHEGEENGEITLDMALSALQPSEAIARLQTGQNIKAGPSEPFELGILQGLKFTAERMGNGAVMFQDSGYHSEATGLPLEIYVVSSAGKTVTI
ncbi:MAG TPA: hypothetical protein VIV15_10445, partial [Anaerolineales bacterium]